MLRTFILILLISFPVFGQTNYNFEKIGNFLHATSFDVNAAGSIFICDSETNELVKLSADGKILKTIGGYGWDDETFDYPIHVFATTLNVYVTDLNNHRIQIFDKDLNFLSKFTTKNSDRDSYSFAYPKSCVVSNQGDLFILDGDNQRVLKYDLNGRFVTEIGNTDAGEYALNSPQKMAISSSSKLFISDESEIKIFDLFGNGMLKIFPGLKNPSIRINENILSINSEKEIKYLNLSKSGSSFEDFFLPENELNAVESIVTDKSIFVLTAGYIIKYTR